MEPSERQAEFLKVFLGIQDDMRAVIGSLVRNRTACDDIFQEVALVLWKKFDQYDPSRPFGAWARGIAVRKVMQSFDKNRRTPTPLSPDVVEALLGAFNEEKEPDQSAEKEALRVCMKKLPDRSRHLLELRYEKAMKLHEMGVMLDTTLDAVHKALSRLRARLRSCMEKQLRAV